MQYIAFTICSNNYISQAITLGDSLIKHNPGWKYIIGLVDKLSDAIDYSRIPYELLLVENVEIEQFQEMFLRYNIIELNTAVKPFYFKKLFSILNKNDVVIYFDPDIYVYNSLTTIEQKTKLYDILLIPHITTPLVNDGNKPDENDILNTGLFNLGFITIKNCEIGKKMVAWWADRLVTKAFIDFEKGLFTDQIWMNLVPLYFERVNILLDAGYNVAYWNIHERNIVQEGKELEVICKDKRFPLAFYHFSGYKPLIKDEISKYQNRYKLVDYPILQRLFREYGELLLKNDYTKYQNIPCYYKEQKDKYNNEQHCRWLNEMPRWKRVLRVLIKNIIYHCKIEL